MKNNYITIIIPLLILMLFSCKTPQTKPNSSIKPDTKTQTPSTVLNVSIQTAEQTTERYHYQTELPTFSQFPLLNKKIDTFVQNQFKIFDKQSNANGQLSKMGNNTHEFIVNYQESTLDTDLISFILENYQFTGGANGISVLKSINFLPHTNTEITILDVPRFFNIQLSKTEWVQYLSEKTKFYLENKYNNEKDDFLSQMINDGTTPNASNFEVFTLKGKTVRIYFVKYSVLPGNYGTVYIDIPL